MYLRTILLFILCIPSLMFAQQNSSIDFVGGIGSSFRNLKITSTNTTFLGIHERREMEETPKANWRLGFHYNRPIANQIHFKTGIRLASFGFKGEKKTDLRWASCHDGEGGFTPCTGGATEIQFVPNFLFLEVPIMARIAFNDKKWQPYIELGIAPALYLTTRTKVITNLDKEVFTTQEGAANQFQLFGNAATGINYHLSTSWQFFGQLSFSYQLTPISDAPIKQHLFFYGMELGVRKEI